MKKRLLTFLLIAFSIAINSQTIFGKWHSKNDETGKIDSVIEVYKKDGKAFGKIIEVKNPERQNAVCDLCEGEDKGKKILGLNILTDLEKDGNEWSEGTILDPNNGKIYTCYIELINPNKLKIRAYIGVSLLGRTVYWERAGV
jgi:uncharacterized protein (DUF2147 family)